MNTIVAIASAPGMGAIALIRVSGEDAVRIVGRIVLRTSPGSGVRGPGSEERSPGSREKGPGSEVQGPESGERGPQSPVPSPLSPLPPWRVQFSYIVDGDRVLDEVLLTYFKAPRSYTGEDLIEISCHGSEYIQQEILHLLIRNGARMASPGEFTQRAFLNGKLDLSQAEAVSDLIASSSKASHQLAMDQMRGGFSGEINDLRSRLLDLVSLVELELDFAEEDVEFADRSQLSGIVEEISEKVDSLTRSFHLGNVLKNGVPVAIVGETNVGKSTLLNALLKEDRAIVSEIPGTTRDTIEDTIQIEGILFRFIDTAGLRHTEDSIETIGIERSYQQMEKARVIILVTDPTAPEEESLEWVKAVTKRIRDDQSLIVVVNKGDLVEGPGSGVRGPQSRVQSPQSDVRGPGSDSRLILSAKDGVGLVELEEVLLNFVTLRSFEDHDVIVTNARHYDALVRVQESVVRVRGGLETGLSGDFLSQDIREILHFLGEITGEISTDEILGNIFGKFCIGK
ncbi:MAG: tRNA uridine-5-carboxymethylaminomethyl(34) synthesis GTPase MnmE [Bacteroidetes bacterium]|jgi:tRNA modification GTPase|nr:tRNA uridine-5-carboxymethylaminomethyl(34) synthesis GTPase MnmE [Bacteroidota bacterium]MBT7462716.1 tRNA uridine-5-carboxymethylaminomethyl(34) synthesis GTPase MnmE [Bacteroidota bacterium]